MLDWRVIGHATLTIHSPARTDCCTCTRACTRPHRYPWICRGLLIEPIGAGRFVPTHAHTAGMLPRHAPRRAGSVRTRMATRAYAMRVLTYTLAAVGTPAAWGGNERVYAPCGIADEQLPTGLRRLPMVVGLCRRPSCGGVAAIERRRVCIRHARGWCRRTPQTRLVNRTRNWHVHTSGAPNGMALRNRANAPIAPMCWVLARRVRGGGGGG